MLQDVYLVYWAYAWLAKRYENTHSMTDGGSTSPSKSLHVLSLDVFPDHPSPGRGVAPGALCVYVMQQGAGHPRVFRERWTGLLWEGLPSSLFPSLWILQGPNHGGSSTYSDVVIKKWVHKKHDKLMPDFPNICGFWQNILTALDQSWHPEHFFCTHCGNLFGTEGQITCILYHCR